MPHPKSNHSQAPETLATTPSWLGRYYDWRFFGRPSINDRFHAVSPVSVSDDPREIASPVEARVHHIGAIDDSGILMGKYRKTFAVSEIFGSDAERFSGYHYANLYLSPQNIHFFVFPTDGTIRATHRHEGQAVFPTLLAIENFTRIEILPSAVRRNACIGSILHTTLGYDLGIVAIGSLNVNGISIISEKERLFQKGDWYGDFRLGSTVLILYPPHLTETKQVGENVHIGETLLRG